MEHIIFIIYLMAVGLGVRASNRRRITGTWREARPVRTKIGIGWWDVYYTDGSADIFVPVRAAPSGTRSASRPEGAK